jgi:hypothetical protein
VLKGDVPPPVCESVSSGPACERGLLQRLMKRLREIAAGPAGFSAVLATSLSG